VIGPKINVIKKYITFCRMLCLHRRSMFHFCFSSDRLINDQISIAMETRDHLMTQRQAFKRIRTRFNDISNRFPAVNSLLQRINLRKRRDSVILGLVIGICTFLMLLYAFHWIFTRIPKHFHPYQVASILQWNIHSINIFKYYRDLVNRKCRICLKYGR